MAITRGVARGKLAFFLGEPPSARPARLKWDLGQVISPIAVKQCRVPHRHVAGRLTRC